MVKICEVVNGCEDCPKYGDDCDGDSDRMPKNHDGIITVLSREECAQLWLIGAECDKERSDK